MISLSEIIKESLNFINYQLDEEYDKYEIETHLKWQNNREISKDVMPEIVRNWGIDEDKVILILSCHHDTVALAYEYDSPSELEKEILDHYLDPFITYLIPVVKGKVTSFKLFDKENNEIIKEYLAFNARDEINSYKVKWN